MIPAQFGPYLAMVVVLTLAPGPDMALVLKNGIRGGSRAAWWTGLGCCLGLTGWAACSALGLAAVLAASGIAFSVVRMAGAIYLSYLGARSLWHARQGTAFPAGGEAPASGMAVRTAFRQGLISNLLNPKIVVIFLTLIPQFVSPGEPPLATTAILAGTFLAYSVLWWRVFSLAVGHFRRLLARRAVRAWIECLTGLVLIGLGIRVGLVSP